jgi:hypothetical protein
MGHVMPLFASLPSPETIRQKAEEVVARPDYQLDSQLDPESLSLWLRLLLWLLTPFRWFFRSLEGMPDFLRWIVVIVLTIILVLLLVHIVWTFVRAVRGTPRRRFVEQSRGQERTVEHWEQESRTAASRGDFISAVRYLFLASLRRIERAEKRKLRRGITNRELLRRYRASPLCEPLNFMVETIELKWYGHEICQQVDFEKCRDEYARVCQLIPALQGAAASEETTSTRDQNERRDHALGT